MAKVAILNQQHPTHDAARLVRLRALLDGGPAFHAIKKQLFPKRALESDDAHKTRLKQVGYTNHAGTVVGVLGALLFSEAPTLSGVGEDDTDSYYARLWKDCDGKGTSFKSFWRECLNDAQAGQHAWVWVNLPKRPTSPDGQPLALGNRLEQEKGGFLDAYLVRLQPEQVIDWEEDERGRLQWILFRSIEQRRAAPEAPRRAVWRWTYIDAEVIREWEWAPKEGGAAEPPPDADAAEVSRITHGIGALPVTRLTLPKDLWAMGRLEDPALRATRARNDLSAALHQAASELLVITSTWGDEEIRLGHAAYLRLARDKSGADSAQYVAPSGIAFQYLQQDVEKTRDEIYRVVQQMALSVDPGATKQRSSGESKAMDWRATEIVLATLSDLVREAMTRAIKLIAVHVREEVKPADASTLSIAGLDSWTEEALLEFLDAADKATDARQLSPTFVRVVARRQVERLLGDEVDAETINTILDEIEHAATPAAADADLDQQRTQLAEALALLAPDQRLTPAKRTKAHAALTALARTLQVRTEKKSGATDPNDQASAA